MTTYNTGNPIGSTDARDRSDNSENFDKALNDTSLTWVDRRGVTRDTFEGRLVKGSFYRVGTFAAGYTLTNMRQTLEYSGHEYSWAGTFPKVVAAGATPATSGGIGAGAWVDRTDETLRGDINVVTKRFFNVDGFVSDTSLVSGSVIETLGFYSPGDGGGARYLVSAGTADGLRVIQMSNGLVAKLICDNNLNLRQFGAKGIPTFNDLPSFQSAFNYAYSIANEYTDLDGDKRKVMTPFKFNFDGCLYFGSTFYHSDTLGLHIDCDISPANSFSTPTDYLIDSTDSSIASIDFKYSGTMNCLYKSNGIRNTHTWGFTLDGTIVDFYSVGVSLEPITINGNVMYGHEFWLTEKGRITQKVYASNSVPAGVTSGIGLNVQYHDCKVHGTIYSCISANIYFDAATLLIGSGAHIYGEPDSAYSIQCTPNAQGLLVVGAYIDKPNMLLYYNADIKDSILNCMTGYPAITIAAGYGTNVNIKDNTFIGRTQDTPTAITYGDKPARNKARVSGNTTRNCGVAETMPYKLTINTTGVSQYNYDFSGLVDTLSSASIADMLVTGSPYTYNVVVANDLTNKKVYVTKLKRNSSTNLWEPTTDGTYVTLKLYLAS